MRKAMLICLCPFASFHDCPKTTRTSAVKGSSHVIGQVRSAPTKRPYDKQGTQLTSIHGFRTLHQPISYTALSRAATLPTIKKDFAATERLQQLTSHLMRSRTTWTKIVEKFVGKTETTDNEIIKANMPEEATEKPSASTSKPLGLTSIDRVVEDKKHQLPPWPSPPPTPHKDYVHANPPEPPTYRKFTVFTAGSIEMGNAVNWQPLMAAMLSHLPITVCNPRKGSWDQSIKQQAKDELFKQQVVWELGALEQADVICFFFDTETKSPVSLLELGLWAASDKVVVCCGDTYWKSGNVHLTCERYGVPHVNKFTDLVPLVVEMLEKKGMKLDDKGDLIGENVHVPKEKPKKKTQLEVEKADLQKQVDDLLAKLATQPKMQPG